VKVTPWGTDVAGCEPDLQEMKKAKLGITENRILFDLHDGSFGRSGSGLHRSSHDDLGCTPQRSYGQAIVQLPWDLKNFYEWYGDWVTLWETMASMKLNPSETDIFLVVYQGSHTSKFNGTFNLMQFDVAWLQAFGTKRYHVGTGEQLFGKEGLCFKRLVTVPHGGISTETFKGGRAGGAPCASPTMMASALYLKGLFAHNVTGAGKQVTLLMRKGARAFANEAAAVALVKRVLPATWSMETFRPENLSMAEQMAVAARSNVMIGTHGAGLTFALFLPPHARVVELFCSDRSPSNGHYKSLVRQVETDGPEPDGSGSLEGMYHFTIKREKQCILDENVVAKAIQAYEKGAGWRHPI